MGILNRLFGSKEPAPAYEVHPDDQELITLEDAKWWETVTIAKLKSFEEEDNGARIALFTHLTKNQGMSTEKALDDVKRSFPMYYLTIKQREDKPFLEGDKAKLPYILKQRINNTVIPRMTKKDIDNGYIHSFIRRCLKGQ